MPRSGLVQQADGPTPYACGTSVMQPTFADYAPKASRSSLPGMFAKNMTTILHALAGIWSLLAVSQLLAFYALLSAKGVSGTIPHSTLLTVGVIAFLASTTIAWLLVVKKQKKTRNYSFSRDVLLLSIRNNLRSYYDFSIEESTDQEQV
jgi:hypothetical protein